ncbi:MAG: choice-of-anchor V domain-containing protein [Candidatus Eisenbacteria bacterium]
MSRPTRHMVPFAAAIAVAALAPTTLLANSTGPVDGRAGDPPAFQTCKDAPCHNSFELNSGDGSLVINGLPAGYTPGTVYTLEVMIADPGQSRWGFEATVIDAAGDQAGDLAAVDPTLVQVSAGAGPLRDYIKHRAAGTFAGQPDAASWEIEWTAPASGSGTASFYLAGNAANNNGFNNGDYIYTFTADVPEGDTSGIDPEVLAANSVQLSVFPSPVRSDATIRLQLPSDQEASLVLVDMMGRQIRSLRSGFFAAGDHLVAWDGRDDHGREVSAGVYYSVFTSGKTRTSGSLVVVK